MADFVEDTIEELQIGAALMREYTPVNGENGNYYRKSVPWAGKRFTVDGDVVKMPDGISKGEVAEEVLEQWVEFAERQQEMEGKEFEGPHEMMEELIRVHNNG